MSKNKVFDVVIVGAGVVGSILAKELTRAGKSVVLLEAGKPDALTYKGYQSYVENSYVYPNRPNSPYPQNDKAPMPGIPYPAAQEESKDTANAWFKTNYWLNKGPVPFGSDYARALGGTTLHWLGVSMRHVPNDFRLKSKYLNSKKWRKKARDWPVSYEILKPYYRRAEYELGVAADVKEQSYLGMTFEEGYEYPMVSFPMTYFDYTLQQDIEGMTYSMGGEEYAINVVPVPQARNAHPNPSARTTSMTAPEGPLEWQRRHPRASEEENPRYHPVGNPTKHGVGLGERCEGNSSCIPICPVQAKYNAVKTLQQSNFEYLDLRWQCVASKVICKGTGHPVTGIEYIRYGNGKTSKNKKEVVRGKIYVLAAHAVENAKLCLMSGVANSSDQMGKNLMDHPYLNFSGLYPKKIWGYRGPDVTGGIPLLRDGPFRKDQASFRTDLGNWGWEFPKGAPGTIVNELVESQGLYGAALRQALEEQGPRHMRIGFLVEQLPDPKNRVTLATKKDIPDGSKEKPYDELGLPRPVLTYDVDDYTLAGMEAAQKFTEAVFKEAGITMQAQAPGSGHRPYKGKTYEFWGSGHLIGTHIMGHKPATSCVDSYQQAHDHPNLYLAGCGSHPTSATANPTLTMAALAFRTLDRITEMLDEEV